MGEAPGATAELCRAHWLFRVCGGCQLLQMDLYSVCRGGPGESMCWMRLVSQAEPRRGASAIHEDTSRMYRCPHSTRVSDSGNRVLLGIARFTPYGQMTWSEENDPAANGWGIIGGSGRTRRPDQTSMRPDSKQKGVR